MGKRRKVQMPGTKLHEMIEASASIPWGLEHRRIQDLPEALALGVVGEGPKTDLAEAVRTADRHMSGLSARMKKGARIPPGEVRNLIGAATRLLTLAVEVDTLEKVRNGRP